MSKSKFSSNKSGLTQDQVRFLRELLLTPPQPRTNAPVFGFNSYPVSFDDTYLGTPSPKIENYMSPVLGTTTIRITDKQIEITGDWSELQTLYALKAVESGSGQRAFWTGEHYTFPIAALPVVEEVFKHRVELPVSWLHEGVARDTTSTISVFLEYCGQCRSKQSKQQQRMTCKACGGSGLRQSQGGFTTAGYYAANCNSCGGNGAIAAYPDVEPYASGWWNGGWNIRFPEKVLRAYFGEPETKFNGNFYEALLKSKDISKRYKQLARQYHPDVYSKGSQMFLKLREAHDVLRDPQRRKRYEAGLKFQQLTVQVKNDVVFEVPKRCGDLLVKGQYDGMEHMEAVFWLNEEHAARRPPRVLIVSEIINWNDRIDSRGRIMTSTWNPRETGNFGRGQRRREEAGEKPFSIEWVVPPIEFIINV